MQSQLAVLLPGREYGALEPALRLPRLAVEQSGSEVFEIQYPFIPAVDDPDAWDTLCVSVAEQISAVLSGRDLSRITFIAKSLGTVVLASLPSEIPLPAVKAIWLTPLFGRESVRRGALAKNWPSLLVAGEADQLHEPEHHDAVADALGAASLVLPRADHTLEIPGDVIATLDGFRVMTEAVLDFVG